MNVGTNAAAPSGFQTALSQIFPWTENDTVLVTDSAACDGRFVLYAAASATLSTSADTSRGAAIQIDSGVLWLSCTSIIESTVLASLKKIGCDKAVLSSALSLDQWATSFTSVAEVLGMESGVPRLTVCSILSVLERCLVSDTAEFQAESLVKDLFQLIQVWLKARQSTTTKGPLWVIVDDVSALAALVGKRLAYHFILLMQSWKCKVEAGNFGIMMRCANDYDLELMGLVPTSTPNYDWLGSAESEVEARKLRESSDFIPWERALVEFADVIVDVTPLTNGYSRDVHGRLLFRVLSLDGSSSFVYNYCLTDSQVFVTRIASQPYAGK